ncbi:DUF3750 domain-containing protein [Oricola thermophila]|uniref:DUF3750 domain-containing protein n=1 Tax=Oricola thermophila TaxID=2742145 RepID=A0A6N1VI82_9HYPH|nr:DUF3750 domain-containing protein [Oricola thermophila]
MRIFKPIVTFILIAYLAPMAMACAWWMSVDRPTSWRAADWSATGLLPAPTASPEATVHVLAARIGGFKGAFAVHSWIVVKEFGASSYTRYEKVGWGNPIRINRYPADATWYSNRPWIVTSISGQDAEAAIPKIVEAIASYPHSGRGDYRIWPGPNSNSFVAHILREVPELDAVLPPNAVGRDYLPNGRWIAMDRDGSDLHVTLAGLIGISAGLRSGLEIHFLGQTAGLDIRRPAVKIPAIGRIGLPGNLPK